MIVDQARIMVRSGKGGDGCVSFLRLKYVPKGGPNGGDGGNGGSVILQASTEVETLLDFAGRHHWRAPNGQPGIGKQQHGQKGDDLIIALPPGTLVHDDQTGELILDLNTPGQEYVIARGGRGGFGNEHFKSPTNQTPTQFTPGEPAVELNLRLELKLIADIGLVGKPNAGKSTLLARISAATPRIADYPFTTLTPHLGIACLPGERRLVVADIPGVIANAHQGAGLGLRFLRHIERTGLLVHLIEIEPTDGSDPVENYRTIRHELRSYSEELATKPEVIVLSKMDLLPSDEDRRAAASMLAEALGQEVFSISAASGLGVESWLESVWTMTGKQLHEADGWPTEVEKRK
jgi:GTP-binding protein